MRGAAGKYVLLALVFALAGVSTGLFLTVRKLSQVSVQSSWTRVEPAAESQGEQGTEVSRRTAIVQAAERVGPATV